MIRHSLRHLHAAPCRAAVGAQLVLVLPGWWWGAAPRDNWMLAWAPAPCPPTALARFLKREWFLRRMDVHTEIMPAAGISQSPDRLTAPGAAAALGAGCPRIALKSGDGHAVCALHAGPAPPFPGAPFAPAVLAETPPLSPLRFVPAARMREEALHLYIDDATGVWRRWTGPCAAA